MDQSVSEATEKPSEIRIKVKKSTSREAKKRPKSVSKYNITLSDYNSGSRTQKRHSNSSVIQKILKKSLLKAKNLKLTQTRESKLKLLKEEIRKNEIDYKNKKIRIVNCLSTKNKRTKSKEKHLKTQENNISSILRPNISPLPKKTDQSLLTTLKRSKKQMSEKKAKKKTLKTKKELGERLKKKGKKCENIENFFTRIRSRDSFSSDNSSSIFKSQILKDVNRNISFIQDESIKDEGSIEKYRNAKTIETDIKLTDTEDERKSTDFAFKFPLNTLKSPAFNPVKPRIPDLEIENLENINFYNKKNRKLEISSSHVFQVNTKKKELQINKENSISVNPKEKKSSFTQSEVKLSLLTQSAHSILPKTRVLKQSKITSVKIKPFPNPLNLENFSWNLALIFLIDQLHLYEISSMSESLPNISTSLLKKIGKKYSGVKSFLQNSFDEMSNTLLENLSFEQHTAFIQNTHTKKMEIQKVLTDIFEDCLESNEAGEESLAGISHSESLHFLHESPEKKEKKSGRLVSFGFEVGEDKENPNIISISEEGSMGNIMDSVDLKNLVESVYKIIDWEFIRDQLKKPLAKDPLTELDRLQETQIGSPIETEIFNYPKLFDINETMDRLENSEKLEDFEKIHRKMVLCVLSNSLQQFRPFGYRGLPLPWSQENGMGVKVIDLEGVKREVLKDLVLISSFQIGSVVEIDANMNKPSDAQLIKVKERQLDKILFFEAALDEYKWVDYDFEESQVKIDVSDIILQDLALELINIMD